MQRSIVGAMWMDRIHTLHRGRMYRTRMMMRGGAKERSLHPTDRWWNPSTRRTLTTTKERAPPPWIVSWYSAKLDSHPYLTKGITSGLIAASGDLLCQSISAASIASTTILEEDNPEGDDTAQTNRRSIQQQQDYDEPCTASTTWDALRTLRFGLLGAFYVAPGCHVWYGALARWFPISTNRATTWPVLQRVAADQFLFTPVFLVGWLSLLWTMELGVTTTTTSATRGFRDKVEQTEFRQILLANWTLWIPVQALNFHYIPTKYQVLCSNGVALVWNTYLSYMTTTKPRTDAVPPTECA